VTKRRLLYLPIETKARELLGKTFLAAKAVERGWIVVMGAHPDTRKFMLEHPAGLYVETSIPDAKAERLERIHSAGHRIANMCEESIVYADGRDYCMRKLGLSSLRWTDLLLVPGERNAEHIHAYRPEGDSKVVITGNPRFDTLLPGVRCVYNHDAEAIKETFGRFVLVNTNFGRPNPHRPDDDPVAKLIARGMIHEGSEADFIRRHLSFKRRRCRSYRLAAILPLWRGGSVVRPHPVENHDVARMGQAAQRPSPLQGCQQLMMEPTCRPPGLHSMEGLLLDRAVFSHVRTPTASSSASRIVPASGTNEELANSLSRARVRRMRAQA
jgi:surface carbohydrate biosynthesis protein